MWERETVFEMGQNRRTDRRRRGTDAVVLYAYLSSTLSSGRLRFVACLQVCATLTLDTHKHKHKKHQRMDDHEF